MDDPGYCVALREFIVGEFCIALGRREILAYLPGATRHAVAHRAQHSARRVGLIEFARGAGLLGFVLHGCADLVATQVAQLLECLQQLPNRRRRAQGFGQDLDLLIVPVECASASAR